MGNETSQIQINAHRDKGLKYFISVKCLILVTSVSQRPWFEVQNVLTLSPNTYRTMNGSINYLEPSKIAPKFNLCNKLVIKWVIYYIIIALANLKVHECSYSCSKLCLRRATRERPECVQENRYYVVDILTSSQGEFFHCNLIRTEERGCIR